MIKAIVEFFNMLAGLLYSLLPTSPFVSFFNSMQQSPFLGYLNYFLPVAEAIVILQTWLVAIAVYYAYQMIMRFINMIE